MALTPTTLIGGTKEVTGRFRVKVAEVLNIDPDTSENVIAVIKASDYTEITTQFVNRSAAHANTVKAYATLKREVPTAISDDDVTEIDSNVVALSTTDFQSYTAPYRWIIITETGAGAESDIADLYVMCRKV